MIRGIVLRLAGARLALTLPTLLLPPSKLVLLLLLLLLPATTVVGLLSALLFDKTASGSRSAGLLPMSRTPLSGPPICVRNRALSCCPCRLSGLYTQDCV